MPVSYTHLQPSTGLVNRPSGSGEVHQKKRNGSRNNCGNGADAEDLRIHILHDRTCLRPNCIRGKSTSGKPVSYTHLDVYKRQLYHRMPGYS